MTDVRALIFDLDGVLTDTASLHFRAWKRLFDSYLEEQQGEDFRPFTKQDYRRYVDGKPRYDGAESFLASRGISLPRGRPDDPPDLETVCGLGNRKNGYYHEILEAEGAEPFPEVRPVLRRARRRGLGTGVVSSSRNGSHVVEAAGIAGLFSACVDGNDLQELELEGKPAPDLFLEAARRLGVQPGDAAIFEDARAGVEAGRRGGFGLVVGVAREHGGEDLDEAGADVVVDRIDELDLDELRPGGHG